MKKIKGIEGVRLLLSRTSKVTLVVALIAPTVLSLMAGQLHPFFVAVWGGIIVSMAIGNWFLHSLMKRIKLFQRIILEAVIVFIAFALTYLILRDYPLSDPAVLVSAVLLMSVTRIAFVFFFGTEPAPTDQRPSTVHGHADNAGL